MNIQKLIEDYESESNPMAWRHQLINDLKTLQKKQRGWIEENREENIDSSGHYECVLELGERYLKDTALLTAFGLDND